MATFRLSGTVTISIFTDVEAETLDEAIEKAEARPMCTLVEPNRMGCSPDEYWCHSGELDGTPSDIREAR